MVSALANGKAASAPGIRAESVYRPPDQKYHGYPDDRKPPSRYASPCPRYVRARGLEELTRESLSPEPRASKKIKSADDRRGSPESKSRRGEAKEGKRSVGRSRSGSRSRSRSGSQPNRKKRQARSRSRSADLRLSQGKGRGSTSKRGSQPPAKKLRTAEKSSKRGRSGSRSRSASRSPTKETANDKRRNSAGSHSRSPSAKSVCSLPDTGDKKKKGADKTKAKKGSPIGLKPQRAVKGSKRVRDLSLDSPREDSKADSKVVKVLILFSFIQI